MMEHDLPAWAAIPASFCVLAASIITSSAIVGRPVLHEVMITVFLILTSPVTAMMLMRAAVFRNRGTN